MVKSSELSTAVGDYLKRLYFLQGGLAESSPVGTGELARAMGVSPPSATAMVRRLAREGLVAHERYRGVQLTELGYREAVVMIRKHRLVEALLHQVLGLDWSEVHVEAEQLEHAVSDKLLSHIDRYLGFPAADPHGDPIPNGDGRLRGDPSHQLGSAEARQLSTCEEGEEVWIARVTRQDEAFLRYLSERGLVPGAKLRIVSVLVAAGVIIVDPAESDTTTLSFNVAQTLLVE